MNNRYTYAVLIHAVSLIFLCFSSFNSYAAEHSVEPPAHKKVLLVGTVKANHIPYFAINDDNKIAGLYPEYIEYLAQTLHLQVQYQLYDSVAELETAAQNNRIDIALGLASTPQREEYLTYSHTILSIPRNLLLKTELASKPRIFKDKDIKLAISKSDVQKDYITNLFPNLEIFELQHQNDIIPALTYNLANAHFNDSLTNQYLASTLEPGSFSVIALDNIANKKWHIPLLKSNTALNQKINALIDKTDPVTLSSMVSHASKWQRQDKKSVMLVTPNQQDWLAQHSVLRYTTLANWHTITMQDKAKRPMGLSISVLNRIATMLGVTLEYVPSSSYEEAIALLTAGKVDIIPAMLRTNERTALVNFSDPYLSTPWSLITLKDSPLNINKLRFGNYKIISPNGDYARAILQDYFPDSQFSAQNSMEKSLQLLNENKVDAVFTTLATSQSWLAQDTTHTYKLLQNFSINNNVDVQLGISKQAPLLLELVNQALAAIGYEELESLSRSWIELNVNQGVTIKKIIFYSLLASTLFILVVVGFLYWNQKLRQEVNFRRIAQHRALQAEQKLTSIANAIPGAVVQFRIENKQLIFSYASQGIERFTPFKQINLSAEHTINSDDSDFFKLISQPQIQQLIDAAKQALEDKQGIDFEFVLNAPYNNWLNLVAFPANQDDDCEWSGVLLEISQRKEQEIALSQEKTKAEQAAITKSRFLAMMSHEIRTPLSGVITTAELLSQSCLDYQQRDDINTIATSANNLLHILNDVLDHTKMEEQQFAIEKVECDLLDIVENAIRAHVANAQAKNLQMSFDFDPRLQRLVETDPVRLQQVLSNLLSNAVKFTEQGNIAIAVKPLQSEGNIQHVEFTVTDNGLGIAQENQSKLFTPFMQAESSTNRQFGGTGLGLSICRMLVNRLGGEISLKSDLGKGSEFSFVIPLESYRDCELPKTPLQKSLLILDDGSDCIKQVMDYLSRWQVAFIHETNNTEPTAWRNPQQHNDCVIIYHNQLNHLQQLKTADSSNVWVKLCAMANSELDADYFLPTNPLLLSPLIKILAKAYNNQLMDFTDTAQEQKIVLQTKQQAIDSGRLILVAEDHPTNRRVIKRQLESLGYQADYVENGVQALEAIAKQDYNLLITDCHMPELDGYGLTQQLRQQGSTMPIIAFTANALTGEAQRCIELGMNGYISKPVSQSVLQAKLNKYLPNLAPDTALPNMILQKATDMQFNVSELQKMFGSKESVLALLREFINSAEIDIIELNQAYAQHDFTQLSAIAHRFKGAAQMVMASTLSELAEKLENAAKQQQAALCELKISALNDCLSVYKNSLN